LEKAYQEANIDPRTVTYLEAHGTGTQLGDSIEIDALKTAFKSLITRSQQEPGTNDINASLAVEGYCGLGSVKIKNLNTNPLNPYLQLNESPFFVVQNAQKWQALSDGSGKPIPRRAGVSSFGMGGVNAHVILEEYTNRQQKIKNNLRPLCGRCWIMCWHTKNYHWTVLRIRSRLDGINWMSGWP